MSEGSLFLGEYPTAQLQMLEPWSSLQSISSRQLSGSLSSKQLGWSSLLTYMSFVEEGLVHLIMFRGS